MPANDDVPLLAAAAGDDASTAALRTIRLASAIDFAGFRRACRLLWSEQVAPERVRWLSADDAGSELFAVEPDAPPALHDTAGAVPPVNAPAAFLPLSESVILHRDPGRFALLYRLLWRLQLEPGLRRDPLDADWRHADEMAQAVRRDIHAMKAGVRFRTVADESGGTPRHMAWYQPAHHIVEATAPFFAERFAPLRWTIVTPERSVRWDGERLRFGPGASADPIQSAERSFAMPSRKPTEPQPTPGRAEMPGGDSPRSLPALREALQRCRECPIGEHASQAVAGEGPRHARLMFVGEQPGDQEDLQGPPFVGPAGKC